ncbi:hypothetical protein P5V15_010198 [Pogonomyrmex californicus]
MTPARGVACAIAVIAAIRDSAADNDSAADSDEEAIRFLQTYEYLDGDNVQTISDNATLALRHAIALFQDESILRVTEVAFEMWTANLSLTFERDTMNPAIVLSFRKGFHTFVDPRHRGSRICPSLLDGPDNVLAHAFLPSSEVSEVHVDNVEKWHIELTANPDDTIHLLHTLTHEIGHALGLHNSLQKGAIMYAFVSSKTFPVRLSEADFPAIQNLYDLRNKSVLRPA